MYISIAVMALVLIFFIGRKENNDKALLTVPKEQVTEADFTVAKDQVIYGKNARTDLENSPSDKCDLYSLKNKIKEKAAIYHATQPQKYELKPQLKASYITPESSPVASKFYTFVEHQDFDNALLHIARNQTDANSYKGYIKASVLSGKPSEDFIHKVAQLERPQAQDLIALIKSGYSYNFVSVLANLSEGKVQKEDLLISSLESLNFDFFSNVFFKTQLYNDVDIIYYLAQGEDIQIIQFIDFVQREYGELSGQSLKLIKSKYNSEIQKRYLGDEHRAGYNLDAKKLLQQAALESGCQDTYDTEVLDTGFGYLFEEKEALLLASLDIKATQTTPISQEVEKVLTPLNERDWEKVNQILLEAGPEVQQVATFVLEHIVNLGGPTTTVENALNAGGTFERTAVFGNLLNRKGADLKALHAYGIQLDAELEDGTNAMHYAITFGASQSTIKFLMDQGVKVKKNNYGYLPSDYIESPKY
ncbi:hypothetical protein BIW53_07565 [Pseudoalteromonas byunsanensis]|uniref:Uncharacterized protein n=2 Tax=Pseudoalteromonas byunsanensis TaxID=327939 RepID=A0A1S1N8Q1_9GAMM|nr:hypothetical protein BIW53_07565 [Pseudoalteromonas byunsanensis]